MEHGHRTSEKGHEHERNGGKSVKREKERNKASAGGVHRQIRMCYDAKIMDCGYMI